MPLERERKSHSLNLNPLPSLPHTPRYPLEINDAVRLYNPQEVLLEEGIVKGGEVRSGCWVGGEFGLGAMLHEVNFCRGLTRNTTYLVIPKRFLELCERPIFVCACDGAHGGD